MLEQLLISIFYVLSNNSIFLIVAEFCAFYSSDRVVVGAALRYAAMKHLCTAMEMRS